MHEGRLVRLRVEDSQQIPQDHAFVFGMAWMSCAETFHQVSNSML
jgi:hypothetical protein